MSSTNQMLSALSRSDSSRSLSEKGKNTEAVNEDAPQLKHQPPEMKNVLENCLTMEGKEFTPMD
ncbi:hypothetical protein FOG18_03835 [Legionella israelensis]|uniref:hypothetical protein n=1 Tax=Legionella israelensis TaxID=454 RepID=UPI00117C1032|nr:hypothetical protein [Legionella israelensis]QDP71762.1 hypothetical protein FOG18_03835 [Legionella israelensis]